MMLQHKNPKEDFYCYCKEYYKRIVSLLILLGIVCSNVRIAHYVRAAGRDLVANLLVKIVVKINFSQHLYLNYIFVTQFVTSSTCRT